MPKLIDVQGSVMSFPETMPDHEIASHVAEHLGLKREDRIRGSADLPLTKDGKAAATELGRILAQSGGFDRIAASPKKRTMETAQLMAPNAWLKFDPRLGDMHYGEMEGQKSADAIPTINDFIVNKPDERLPGTSKYSGDPGESFNEYKSRLLPAIVEIAKTSSEHPNEKVALILNRRSMKTLSAWMAKGSKPDLETDPEMATAFEHNDIPNGSIWRVTQQGLLQASPEKLKPGLYVMRHQATHWNS